MRAAPDRPVHPVARRALHCIALFCIALLWLAAGCAQLGVPAVPPLPAAGPWPADAVYVAYDPHTVLGFGHTGVIVSASAPRGGAGGGFGDWLRFDQYASAELAYGERLQAGTTRFWEPVTARLPSIFGLTRERVTRRAGPTPAALTAPGERLLRVPGLDAATVRAAAEARHGDAATLEAPGALRYGWTFNNCHHFVRDVLRAGGPIHERYFPKHFVADTVAHPGAPSAAHPPPEPPAGAAP
jgi:hypothetical protein